MDIPKQLTKFMALTKCLKIFKIGKVITFSHLNYTNFNDYFKGNFVQEKVNKMSSKAKTLNISVLETN